LLPERAARNQENNSGTRGAEVAQRAGPLVVCTQHTKPESEFINVAKDDAGRDRCARSAIQDEDSDGGREAPPQCVQAIRQNICLRTKKRCDGR